MPASGTKVLNCDVKLWDIITHSYLNTLRPRQDGRHFADDIFTCIFFNENCCILIKFSLKYVHEGPNDNNPALVQIMAWRRSGDKPLSEPMMVSLPTHICVTRPQWVNVNACLAPSHCLKAMMTYCHLGTWEKLKWIFNKNIIIFIQENSFQHIINEMTTIVLVLCFLVVI